MTTENYKRILFFAFIPFLFLSCKSEEIKITEKIVNKTYWADDCDGSKAMLQFYEGNDGAIFIDNCDQSKVRKFYIAFDWSLSGNVLSIDYSAAASNIDGAPWTSVTSEKLPQPESTTLDEEALSVSMYSKTWGDF